MATGTVPTTLPPPPPIPVESLEHERVIQRQLGRTSWHVRLVDLGSSLAIWAVGVVAFFIAIALFDHLIGLGLVGRLLGLVALVAGSAWYAWAVIWPLLARGINPTYAARTIEEATPKLKNSLINFLLLRQDRSTIKEIVFQAVERKAASDIAAVPVEATVDRTALIRAGYVLCIAMALLAAYKILSPKDPFQTVARVLAPWAEIARPSRVQITDVQPGSAEVYHGTTVDVSAIVSGARPNETVKLLYTTADGQTVDQPLEMAPAPGGLRYQVTLPAGSGSSASGGKPAAPFNGLAAGMQQDLIYRIVAGDAESPPYRLTVVSAPTIVVERLEYQYPAYTKKAPEKVLQQGDIKGLEGTRVTIHAVANQPIKSTWIEFDPSPTGAPQLVQLASEGTRAWGTITLELQRDRETAWHNTYEVRFRNQRMQRSDQPIVHKIDVIRDLSPEVQILQPQSLRIEVPEDGEQQLEIRALDPDYGLSAVRLEGAVPGKPPLKIELLPPSPAAPPQVTIPHAFRPRDHKLTAGDELKYVAVAEDNRVNSITGQPEPNTTRTKEYTLVVTAPRQPNQGQNNQNQQPMGGQDPKNQDPKNQNPKKQPQNADPKNQQPNQNPQGKQNAMGGQQQNPMGGQQQQNNPMGGQQQNPMGGQQQNPMGAQQQQQNPMGGQQQQNPMGGQQQQNPMAGGQQNPMGGQQPNNQQTGGQGSPMNGGAGGQSGDPQQANPMNGAGGERTNQGTPGNQAAGNDNQPAGQQGDPNAGASGQPTGAGGKPQGKAHDGEAIEKAIEDLKKRGQLPPQDQGGQPQNPMGGQGQQNAGQPMQNPNQQTSGGQGQTTQPMNPEGSPPQAAGNSGNQGQNSSSTGTPAANQAERDAAGQEQQGAGPRDNGQKGKASDRLPDEQQGANTSKQPGEGNKGGAPQGPPSTEQQPKSKPGEGEQRGAGAGQNGSEGAGDQSKDKGGSGPGQEANRDKPKEQQGGSSRPMDQDPSAASGSKNQSNSKGGQSGDQSGGGASGGGQSAKQKGNDSAGSQSAADQGAGKAEETGDGQTGNKGGTQQKARGKTGKAGTEQGEGSTSKAGNEGDATDSEAGQEGKAGEGAKSDQRSKAGEKGTREGKAGGGQSQGGSGDPSTPPEARETEDQAADEANLEYSRKATELALKRLKDEEHNPDPDLLDKLGWTKDDLAEFLRRWDALQKSAVQTPEGKRELDEALRSLGLRDPNHRKRSAGGTVADKQQGNRDGGNRTAPPPAFRDLFDAFRKGAARTAP